MSRILFTIPVVLFFLVLVLIGRKVYDMITSEESSATETPAAARPSAARPSAPLPPPPAPAPDSAAAARIDSDIGIPSPSSDDPLYSSIEEESISCSNNSQLNVKYKEGSCGLEFESDSLCGQDICHSFITPIDMSNYETQPNKRDNFVKCTLSKLLPENYTNEEIEYQIQPEGNKYKICSKIPCRENCRIEPFSNKEGFTPDLIEGWSANLMDFEGSGCVERIGGGIVDECHVSHSDIQVYAQCNNPEILGDNIYNVRTGESDLSLDAFPDPDIQAIQLGDSDGACKPPRPQVGDLDPNIKTTDEQGESLEERPNCGCADGYFIDPDNGISISGCTAQAGDGGPNSWSITGCIQKCQEPNTGEQDSGGNPLIRENNQTIITIFDKNHPHYAVGGGGDPFSLNPGPAAANINFQCDGQYYFPNSRPEGNTDKYENSIQSLTDCESGQQIGGENQQEYKDKCQKLCLPYMDVGYSGANTFDTLITSLYGNSSAASADQKKTNILTSVNTYLADKGYQYPADAADGEASFDLRNPITSQAGGASGQGGLQCKEGAAGPGGSSTDGGWSLEYGSLSWRGAYPMIVDQNCDQNSRFALDGCVKDCKAPPEGTNFSEGLSQDESIFNLYNTNPTTTATECVNGPGRQTGCPTIGHYIPRYQGKNNDSENPEITLSCATGQGQQGDRPGDEPKYIGCDKMPLYYEDYEPETNKEYYAVKGCYPLCNNDSENTDCIDGVLTINIPDGIGEGTGKLNISANMNDSDRVNEIKRWIHSTLLLGGHIENTFTESDIKHINRYYERSSSGDKLHIEYQLQCQAGEQGCNIVDTSKCYEHSSKTYTEGGEEQNCFGGPNQVDCSTPGVAHYEDCCESAGSNTCSGNGTCLENGFGEETTCICDDGRGGSDCSYPISTLCPDYTVESNGERTYNWLDVGSDCYKRWSHEAGTYPDQDTATRMGLGESAIGSCPYTRETKKLVDPEDMEDFPQGGVCSKYEAIKKRFEAGESEFRNEGELQVSDIASLSEFTHGDNVINKEDCNGYWTNCANVKDEDGFHTGCGKQWIFSNNQFVDGNPKPTTQQEGGKCRIPYEFLTCTTHSCPAWGLASIGYEGPSQKNDANEVQNMRFMPCYHSGYYNAGGWHPNLSDASKFAGDGRENNYRSTFNFTERKPGSEGNAASSRDRVLAPDGTGPPRPDNNLCTNISDCDTIRTSRKADNGEPSTYDSQVELHRCSEVGPGTARNRGTDFTGLCNTKLEEPTCNGGRCNPREGAPIANHPAHARGGFRAQSYGYKRLCYAANNSEECKSTWQDHPSANRVFNDSHSGASTKLVSAGGSGQRLPSNMCFNSHGAGAAPPGTDFIEPPSFGSAGHQWQG